MNIKTKTVGYEISKDSINTNKIDELKEHLTDLNMFVEEYKDVIYVSTDISEIHLLTETVKIYSNGSYSFSDSKLTFIEKLNNHINTIDYNIGQHLYSILQNLAVKNNSSVSFLLDIDNKQFCKAIDKSIKKEQ